MKKTIIIVLIALAATSSAFAVKFNSVGFETGAGYFISADMEIVDNLDVYARLGRYTGFGLSFGAQYKVTDFRVDGTRIDVKPGIQTDFGFPKNMFVFSLLGTCEFSFETGHFGAFVRPGLGFAVVSYKNAGSDTGFNWAIETGVRYLF